VAQRLARYVCNARYDAIPPAVVARAQDVLIHDLLMGRLGHAAPETTRALAFVRGEMGAPGGCAVIGEARGASAADAVFANAVMIRALRQEQTLMPSGIHGGAIMIPVALAVGELHGRSGAEILTALVIGHDVAGKLDRAAPHKRMVRTASHTYGAFGAAATAARLLGLDEDQTATSLAYAGNLAVMIQAGFEDHQYGLIARNGLTCAYLGQAGAPARLDAIEGAPGFYQDQLHGAPSNLEGALATLGRDYEIMGSVLKPFPCGLGASVGAALLGEILRTHGLAAADVASVVVHRPAESNDHLKQAVGPFALPSHAISSVPLALASVMLDGDVTPRRLKDHNAAEVLAEAAKVRFAEAPMHGPEQQRIEVVTRAGAVLSAEGGIERLQAADLAAIVQFHGSTAVSESDIARLRAAMADLPAAPDLSALVDVLKPHG
jgi:2-methylcitrate dehydratase PrpD